jgi:hypothetical protein
MYRLGGWRRQHENDHASFLFIKVRGKILTTMPIPANSTTASANNRAAINFQPSSRLYLPPAMTTKNETAVASSTMVAKDMRKPELRHMEQKNWSPRQSASSGKGRQLGSLVEEHDSCSPMWWLNVALVFSACTVYETQFGVRMETIVSAVAAQEDDMSAW